MIGLCDIVKCPISGDRMHDPVHASDGYVYERSTITSWLQSRPTSPLTGEIMEKTLVPSLTIQLVIDQLRDDETRSRGLMPYIKAVERPPSCAKPYVKSIKATPTPKTMNVSKNVIALVIGSRGKTVRAIEEATGTKITIDQTVDPCLLTFSGQEGGVVSARESIANIVNRSNIRDVDWKRPM